MKESNMEKKEKERETRKRQLFKFLMKHRLKRRKNYQWPDRKRRKTNNALTGIVDKLIQMTENFVKPLWLPWTALFVKLIIALQITPVEKAFMAVLCVF